jgi:DNA repair protein RecN (Recombination protein N)
VLTRLHIQNFIIIEKLELEFTSGLTVITGETGAGKSIVIDALFLLLGGRSDNQVVGPTHDKCHLTACFDIKNLTAAQTWLEANEFGCNPTDECIIRRVLQKDGKSRQMINGYSCTLQQIRDFLPLIMIIHGQHQHQLLMKRHYQRELLDNYIDNQELHEKIKRIQVLWLENLKKMAYFDSLQKNSEMQQELLEYQINEFEKIAFQPEEYETLLTEQRQLVNASQLISGCQEALVNLTEREKNSAESLLYQAINNLSGIHSLDPRISSSHNMIHHAIIQVKEAVSELRHFNQGFDLNPGRLEFLEQKLSKIHELARKYQVSPIELTRIRQELENQLAHLKEAKHHYQLLDNAQQKLQSDYMDAAKQLSKLRTQAARQLSDKISREISQLGMPGGMFQIQVHFNQEITAHGADTIEFLVAPNLGLPFQPLSKIASGGEISRIALAIHVATAQKKITPILIFDEVDVGIGGATASIVGNLLKTLSGPSQILCITHLPQVAAYGDTHFKVQKEVINNQTAATIVELRGNERVSEIARMLGGSHITQKTLAHAKELISYQEMVHLFSEF